MNNQLAAVCCYGDLARWVITQRTPNALEVNAEEIEANACFGYALATYALNAPLNQEDRRLVFSLGTGIFDVSNSGHWASRFENLLGHPQVADDSALQWFVALPLLDYSATAESCLRLAVSLDLPATEKKFRDRLLVGLFRGLAEFPVDNSVVVEIAEQLLEAARSGAFSDSEEVIIEAKTFLSSIP